MPRIDPLQLLNCLNVLLTPSGGIKSDQEVARISSLMEKFSKKLVSKCVYLLILKASDVSLLSMFMASGGWNLIYSWLVHAVEAKNYPFLIELLEVIIICPVDIERLKSNPMPRQIKYLSKDTTIDPKVKDLASDIVKHWLAIVKGAPTTPQPNAEVTPAVQNANDAQPQLAYKIKEEVVAVQQTVIEDETPDGRASSDASMEEEEKEDTNYVKSTSPSSSSLDSDDSDVFVPYKKTSGKKKIKGIKTPKKDKGSRKSSLDSEKPKLKSKLVNDTSSKDPKKASIKLKIEKKKDGVEYKKREKTGDEKTIDEKIKEKRRLKEEKEREKFARLKTEREKKEQKLSKDKDKRDKGEKTSKEKLDDKAKGDLAKLIPKPIDKLGRIPKLNKDGDSSKTQSDDAKRKEETKNDKQVKPEKKRDEATKLAIQRLKEEREREATKKEAKKLTTPVPPKKPVSMSVEKRFAPGESKPKTVKAYNSKFRLTGLEQEVVPKPPSRKPVTGTAPTIGSAEKNALKRSPTKDIENEPLEKKMKSPEISLEEKSPVQNKNKKPFLQESDDFMNAMNAAVETQKELLRKRKKPTKNDDSTSPTPKTGSDREVKPAFKFYKDTLESSMDEGNNESVTENRESPEERSPTNDKDTSADEEPKPTVIKSAEGLKSALALYRAKKAPKKSVKWKTDDELEAVQYFEVDVSERANVVKDFWAMQLKERSSERESLLLVRKTGENDKMTEKIAWSKPVPIDIPPPSTVRGVNSQEKAVQYARERTVPPALYYSKSMIPDTPAEPELEIHATVVPPVIPLEDISGSQDSVNDFSSFKWPEPKQFPPDGSEFMPPNFLAAGVPPPIFPPFPDGTFPPPFTQPFFPGAPVPPTTNWTGGTNDQSQNSTQNNQAMQWVPPPNMVPPVGPGMMGPPPFGMMAPVFPFPGAPPNLFPPPGITPPINNNNSDNQQFSSNNNYSNNSEGGGKKWNNEDRFHRKDSWKNNNYSSDRSNRDKRGSGSWRGSGGNSRLCKFFQKKGYCNSSGCRFYHPEK